MIDESQFDEFCAIAWCQDKNALRFLFRDYLSNERGYIKLDLFVGSWKVMIQPKGWAHIESLQNFNPESKTGFIAMWFDDRVKDAWMAIDEGIRSAGYTPLRIDQKQHNNEITDEIRAEIRKSKFLVADLTDHRNGVYFEAGFAKGLGLEVIWLCRKDELEKAHFDTRQYNFILWEQANLADLTKALKNRIEATIGRGPIPETNKQ